MGNWWAGISEKGDHGRWVLEKRDAETGGGVQLGRLKLGRLKPGKLKVGTS